MAVNLKSCFLAMKHVLPGHGERWGLTPTASAERPNTCGLPRSKRALWSGNHARPDVCFYQIAAKFIAPVNDAF
jgi:hypothetical protein